jgi:vacuolar protein sorting-associated protein 3
MEVETEGEPESVEPSAAVSARRRDRTETGPFVLRSLLEDLPLSADGDREDIEIKCAEFLGIYLLITTLP